MKPEAKPTAPAKSEVQPPLATPEVTPTPTATPVGLKAPEPAKATAPVETDEQRKERLKSPSGRQLYDHEVYGRCSLVKRSNVTCQGTDYPEMARVVAKSPEARNAGVADQFGNDNPMDCLIKLTNIQNANPNLPWHPYEAWIDADAQAACIAQALADQKAGQAIRQTAPEGFVLEICKQPRNSKPRLICQPVGAGNAGGGKAKGDLL